MTTLSKPFLTLAVSGFLAWPSLLSGQIAAPVAQLDSILEAAVLTQDRAALDTLYAADFQFSHGTGEHDTRQTWLVQALATPAPFRSRRVDSVSVELHHGWAVTTGRLWVESVAHGRYAWRYLRVWRLEGRRWQLASHHSVGSIAAE
jgi:hypothetical protein